MLYILKQEELFAETDEELDAIKAAQSLLIQYAYNKRGLQFEEIKDWINRQHRVNISSAAREMGLWSQAGGFGNKPVEKLVTELAQANNQEDLAIPKEFVESTITDGKTIEEFKTELIKESNRLDERIKNEKDPQRKWELRREKNYLDNLYNMLEDGEYAQALDLFISHLNELDTNMIENQEKISEIYREIISYLVSHVDETGRFKAKKQSMFSPETKAKLVTLWSGIKSFRYMCMLSSLTTMGRNALSNTAVGAQSIIEDFVAKGLESRPSMYDKTAQVKFYGSYDTNFSEYVDSIYGSRINRDTAGDKYNSNERDTLKAEYAREKDPLRKNTIFNWIKNLIEKGLNDRPWVRWRVKKNLKNMLAGANNQILWSAEYTLKSRYNIRTNIMDPNFKQELLNKISETNPKLADIYRRAISSDASALQAIVELGNALKLDILEQIYQKSLYSANKLFFKNDNWFSRTLSNLRRTHPVAAEFIAMYQPFLRVAANTTMYTIDRSPIGLIKGVIKYLQTKNMVLTDMQQEILNYYQQQFVKQKKKADKEFKFNDEAFNQWVNDNLDIEIQQAINGDKTAIKNVAQNMVDNGLISPMALGGENIFARGDAIQSISQGMVGTTLMVVGMILAAVLDNFDYEDDDDYLGPILRLGNVKIKLTDLAPFSTMFAVGAMLGSGNIDNRLETVIGVLADQTLLNVVESALSYSNSLADYLENQTINTLQSFIPAITKNISKIWGNKKDKSGGFIDKLWKTTLSNTMFFNYLVADKVNPYTGEPEKYYESGILEGIFNLISPIGYRVDVKSELEREAERLGATTTGISASYTINGTSFSASGKTKQNLGKFRAEYLTEQYDKIVSGKQLVTVKQDDGTYVTTTYNRLTDEQKANVLQNLYSKASDITKIKYWLDSGNLYYENNRNKYLEYSSILSSNSLVYRPNWSGSKFVER